MSEGREYILRTPGALIEALEEGALSEELSSDFREMVSTLHDVRMSDGGKPSGTITLKLKFQMDGGSIRIVAERSVSLPSAKREATMLWATPDNELSRADPKQLDMFRGGSVRSVEVAGGPRSVGSEG